MAATEYTLLALVSEFNKRNGLPAVTSVSGSQDDTVLQVWGALNEGLQDICNRYNLEELQTKLTFQHAGGADYLAWDLNANTPDWKFIIPDTFWAGTTRIKVQGPLSLVEWQTLTTMLVAQSLYSWILYGKAIHIFGVPSPLSSVTFSLFYQSKCGATDSTLGLVDTFVSDTTVCRLPSDVMLGDLNWRWKMKKGLPYAEEQRVFEQMLANMVGRQDQGTLDMAGPEGMYSTFGPGLLVPAGNWNVS